MIKGLYTSASAMIPRVKQQEVTANNIANASTAGFKKERMFARELSKAELRITPKAPEWQQSTVASVHTDFSPGVFDKTDNPLDIAIDGDGFFTLLTEDGTRLLTRAGSFLVDEVGMLSFPGGAMVAGEGGPLTVGSGTISVSSDGEVRSDGAFVGRIRPVTVADLTGLRKVGGSTYVLPEDAELIPVGTSVLRQGYLETANVDIVREMVEMIISFRAFEANARSLQVQDQSLDHLFNRVAGKK